MSDPHRSEIFEANRILHDKIKKLQGSFEAKLQKSLQSFMENEFSSLKKVFDSEVKDALKEHESRISHLLGKSDVISFDLSLAKRQTSTAKDKDSSMISSEIKRMKEKYRENKSLALGFGNPKKIAEKESLSLSQKLSLRNDEDSKDFFKVPFKEVKSTKNARPDILSSTRNKELELRKRFEKFSKIETSSFSSSLSSESSSEKKKKKKQKTKEKPTRDSLSDSSSD